MRTRWSGILVGALVSAGVTSVAAQIYQGPLRPGQPLVVIQRISQEFAVDWSRNSAQSHTGLDLVAPKGSRVFSVKEGVVYKVGNLGGTDGQYVVVFNRDGTSNGYLHLNSSVGEKQRVSVAQELGTVYRDHLHLNQCKQANGCQHGAFPNPTFPGESKKDVTKYYVRPRL